LEKLSAFVAGSAGIAALTSAGWFASVPFVDIDISYGALIVATFNLLPLTLVFGTLAVFASVALRGRQQATGVVTAIAVATFMADYLASLVDVLAPIRWLSPFHYANAAGATSGGIDWPMAGVLASLTVLFALLALRAFERRDIGVRGSGHLLGLTFRRSPAG
jgi:ABC-2 type transport system permease protein